jgi:hypothetical protein
VRSRKIPVSLSIIEGTHREILEGEGLVKPQVRTEPGFYELTPGDLVVHTGQVRALFIATLLECESMSGLSRYPQFASLMEEGVFPFRRIMQEQDGILDARRD